MRVGTTETVEEGVRLGIIRHTRVWILFLSYFLPDGQVFADFWVFIQHMAQLLERYQLIIVEIRKFEESYWKLVENFVANTHATLLNAMTEKSAQLV